MPGPSHSSEPAVHFLQSNRGSALLDVNALCATFPSTQNTRNHFVGRIFCKAEGCHRINNALQVLVFSQLIEFRCLHFSYAMQIPQWEKRIRMLIAFQNGQRMCTFVHTDGVPRTCCRHFLLRASRHGARAS